MRCRMLIFGLVVLCCVPALAGDVIVKTWTVGYDTVGQTYTSDAVGVTGCYDMTVHIEAEIPDTATGTRDSVRWALQTLSDNGAPDVWRWAYVLADTSADSAGYPLQFHFDLDDDSLFFDQVRLYFESGVGATNTAGDTTFRSATGPGDTTGAQYKARVIARKR